MRIPLSISHVSAGLSAVLVAYAGSIVIVIHAATVAGASTSQIESWLLVLGVLMGLSTIAYSLYYKAPVLTAWSTPGAALLISIVNGFSLGETLVACMVTGMLIALTGITPKVSQLVQKIPVPLTTAMLAGILFSFGVKAFSPLESSSLLCVVMFSVYVFAKRYVPRYTMLLLLFCGAVAFMGQEGAHMSSLSFAAALPRLMPLEWSWQAILSISFPLYLVTMVSQNLPGLVMLQRHGYSVPVAPVLIGTGVLNVLCAPFGGFSCNLAAISAGVCMGEEAGESADQRYWAAVSGGIFYLLAGVCSTSLVALFVALPKELTQMLAGFALLGIILSSLADALHQVEAREGALITLLITASGVTFLGVNAPVWGLLAGGVYNKVMQGKAT